jgi:hypothetical protein
MLTNGKIPRLLLASLLIAAELLPFAATAHADCFAADATSRDGTSDGANPPKFGFPGTEKGLAVGAHFESCDAAVRVVYNPADYDVANVSFGQRPQSAGPIAIFSGQLERTITLGLNDTLFTTRPKAVPVYAFFRVQGCDKGTLFGKSNCSAWSPNITIDLGDNELTDYGPN